MQSVPIEVQSLILHHLDPASLNVAYQVCTSWHQTIQQDTFCQSYAQSRTTQNMKALTPEFFEKLLPHFSPAQLFCIEGNNITRHRVHAMAETDSNQLNLRIVKLLSSLDWYQEIIHKNKDLLIKHWHPKDPLRAQQFEESLQYNHLFLLGDSLCFIHNRADAISKEKLAELKGFKLLTKKDLNIVKCFEAMSDVESLLSIDYATLKQVNTKILEDLFQAVFRRYHITHLMDPKRDADKYLYLPNVFFKGLFAALSSQYLKKNTPHSTKPETLSSETPWTFFDIPSLLLKYISSFQTTSKANLTDESLPEGAFKSLRIAVNSDDKLESLRKWIETTQITIEELYLDIGFHSDITIERMKAFGETLLRSNVKSIDFDGEHRDHNLVNLALKIKNSLH